MATQSPTAKAVESFILFGFLNLNKPLGLTSHDCVARVRRLLKLKRVGHAGTLDPAASGVLPIAVGTATRLLQYLPTHKAYRARIRFGQVTTTDDLEGDLLFSTPVPHLTLGQIQAILPQFTGRIQQIPPIYSAIQIEGQRMYKRAMAGETPEIPPRAVEIFSIQVLDWHPGDFPELELQIACGSGTYIRAIARDLGQVLGCGGTLAGLVRTASSGFELTNSLTFEEMAEQLETKSFALSSPDQALGHLPDLYLPPELAYRWCLGQTVPCPCSSEFFSTLEHLPLSAEERQLPSTAMEMAEEDLESSVNIVRLYNQAAQFLGISQILRDTADGLEPTLFLRPKVVLAPPQLQSQL